MMIAVTCPKCFPNGCDCNYDKKEFDYQEKVLAKLDFGLKLPVEK